MKRTVAWLSILPLVTVLAACGGTEGDVTDAGATGVNRPTATVTVTAESEQPAAETVTETVTVTVPAEAEDREEEQTEPEGASSGEVSSGNAEFGETWAWEDGLELTISAPESYQSSSSAAGGGNHAHQVKFTVTIVNNTGENFDPAMFYATVQSGNREGDQIFDSANGLEGSPNTTLLDGRETQFEMAFGVDDPEDIVMEVSLSWDHDSAIYTN